MIKNYLKIALRHISRNKGYLLINVLGLGLGLALCIISFINFQYFQQADTFHEKADNVFRVIVWDEGGDIVQGNVVAPLMTQAVAEVSQVQDGVRLDGRGVVVKIGEELFSEHLTLVDPNFLDVFTYTMEMGSAAVLKDPSKIILTKKRAQKYFGDANPIGKIISINPGTPWQKDLVVGAVIQNPPLNSALRFNLLTHLSNSDMGKNPKKLSNWTKTVHATFLILNNSQAAEEVRQQLDRYIAIENENKDWRKVKKYQLQPYLEVYRDTEDVKNNALSALTSPLLPTMPGVMALLILLTACLNFTNTTISFSNRRLKEMGVRKVMGSNRRQLIFQLLGESFVICSIGLALGIILAHILMPYYNELWGSLGLHLTINYLEQPLLLAFLIGVVLFTTLLGGIYPAFYMSAFRPTEIFSGATKFGGDNWLVRSLLGIQIVISLLAIVGGVTFAENALYQKNLDLGYDSKGIINVPVDGEETYLRLKAAVASHPDIINMAGSRGNLGFGESWMPLGESEDHQWVQVQDVGENFLEVMDIEIVEGRDFDKNRALDFEQTVIVNKKFVAQQQWESALGKEIKVAGVNYNIIGVTENFIPSNPFQGISTNVFRFRKPSDYRNLKVKVQADQMLKVQADLKDTWATLFPFALYKGRFQDEVLAEAVVLNENISKFFIFLALIALLLAATGLYSLVSLNFLKRSKEIAIRRVVGASRGNIAYLINKPYLIIFALAGILGGVIGLYHAQFFLDTIFGIYKDASIISALLSVLFVCLVGLLTIGGKLFAVLRTNPADTLRNE